MRRVLVLLLALGLVGLGCNLATLKPANTPIPQAALPGESTATAAKQTVQAMMRAPARSTPPPTETASGPEAAVSAPANTAAPEATVPPAALRPGELTVAYAVAGDIYVWQPGTHPRRLTEHGQAREVYLSTDAVMTGAACCLLCRQDSYP